MTALRAWLTGSWGPFTRWRVLVCLALPLLAFLLLGWAGLGGAVVTSLWALLSGKREAPVIDWEAADAVEDARQSRVAEAAVERERDLRADADAIERRVAAMPPDELRAELERTRRKQGP